MGQLFGPREMYLDRLAEIGHRLCEIYKRNIDEEGKIATGQLRDTVSPDVEISGTHMTVYLNIQEYAKWIEEGRQPGKMPPVDKIKDWITVKGIVPEARGLKVPTMDQLAWAVAKSIERDGIEPCPLLEKTLRDTEIDNMIMEIVDLVSRLEGEAALSQMIFQD